jgi:hypothetical protein
LAEPAYTRPRFLDVDRTCHDLRFSSAVTAKEYVMTRALISLSAPLTPTVPLEPSRFLNEAATRDLHRSPPHTEGNLPKTSL